MVGKVAASVLCKQGGGRLFGHVYRGKSFDLSDQIENSIIRFNNGFNTGFSKPEYVALTANSKIVLSPTGFCSPECFRIYEAMRQGCVVVCVELPPTDIYKDIPVVQVKSWKNVRGVIGDLLADEPKMKALSEAAIKYYHENLSLEAAAKRIISKI